jgi:acid phosphatase family membrane protein YuiD
MRNIYFIFTAIYAHYLQIHATSSVDWSSYSTVSDVGNYEDSVNIVKNIPIFRYWDNSKAKFRTGVLAEYMVSNFSSFVSIVDRKIADKNGHLVVEKMYVADTNAIFMHMFATVQRYAREAVALKSMLDELFQEKENFALKLIRIANDTGKEWRTASEIRGTREVLENRTKIISDKIKNLMTLTEMKLSNLELRREVTLIRYVLLSILNFFTNKICNSTSKIYYCPITVILQISKICRTSV